MDLQEAMTAVFMGEGGQRWLVLSKARCAQAVRAHKPMSLGLEAGEARGSEIPPAGELEEWEYRKNLCLCV